MQGPCKAALFVAGRCPSLVGDMLLQTILAFLALARIIAGETSGCPMEAKIAVAHVASRNAVWFGDADPTAADLAVALVWHELPDPSRGAVFAIGPGDFAKVERFVGPATGLWHCGPGDFVETRREPGG